MSVRTWKATFNGGEMTEELTGRFDDPKYQSGVALCQNYIPMPHGVLKNRAGFEFVREVKTSSLATVLIPFIYSATNSIVIEMGAGYFRFHAQAGTVMNGSVPYEISNPYAAADLPSIHHTQSADVMTLVHPNYPPKELRRYGSTDWRLVDINLEPTIQPPSSISGEAHCENYQAYFYYYYKVTAVAADGITESAVSPKLELFGNLLSASGYNIVRWPSAAGAKYYNVYKLYGGVYGFIGQTTDLAITDDQITPDTSKTPPIYDETFIKNGISAVGIDNGGSAYTSATTITVTDSTGSGAILTAVIDGGVIAAITVVATGTGYTSPTITVTDSGGGAGFVVGDVSLTGYGYPSAVTYLEQRRCFAGTDSQPQNIWMTRSGTESNMSYSLPTRDDDRIAYRIASGEVDRIRHMIPLGGLILLTQSGEWIVSATSGALTPSSFRAIKQAGIGANEIQPVLVNNTVLYCAARGGHVHELGYSYNSAGYVTGDLSLRANHLFDDYTIVSLAQSKAPVPIIWCVSSSGKLLSLTYLPDQQVGAWAQHVTDGTFESVTVINEDGEDYLYAVVVRTINSASVRYIERLHSRSFTDLADAFFVDCGLTYSGVPTSTSWVISGLTHLRNKTVSMLINGAVWPQQRVSASGTITLTLPDAMVGVGMTAQIGLPIVADVKTLDLAMQIDTAFAQGREKNVNKCWIKLKDAGILKIGTSEDDLREIKNRTTEAWGAPPSLMTKEAEITVARNWLNDGGNILIRQDNPLPVTICGITMSVEVGN